MKPGKKATVSEIPPVSLNGRERILNKAMVLISEKGHKGATVRAIAAAAGVSPALIVHHFGSKENLLSAIDDDVVERFRHAMTNTESLSDRQETLLAVASRLSSLIGNDSSLRGYIRRSITEGGRAGQTIFTNLLQLTAGLVDSLVPEEHLPGGQARRWLACQILIINLAATLLEPVLQPLFGNKLYSHASITKRTNANLAFITGGVQALL